MATAELCASPVDNGTTFNILELGTLHSNQHIHWSDLSLSLVLAHSWLVMFGYFLQYAAYCQLAQS